MKHQTEGTGGLKGAWRSPRTVQFSAQQLQHALAEMFQQSQLLSTPQLQGTGLEMLLELLEVKLGPESTREQELSSHEQEQKELAGRGSGEPWGEERRLHRLQEGKDFMQAVVWRIGLAVAGVEQEQGTVAHGLLQLSQPCTSGWGLGMAQLQNHPGFVHLLSKTPAQDITKTGAGPEAPAGRTMGFTGTDLNSLPRGAELRHKEIGGVKNFLFLMAPPSC